MGTVNQALVVSFAYRGLLTDHVSGASSCSCSKWVSIERFLFGVDWRADDVFHSVGVLSKAQSANTFFVSHKHVSNYVEK